jgi:hypothetical protein
MPRKPPVLAHAQMRARAIHGAYGPAHLTHPTHPSASAIWL